MNAHLASQSLTDPFQSAYKRSHSTETALLWVVNEFRTGLGCRQGSIKCAFDTIDHSLQLHHPQRRISLAGVVLRWVKPYLHDRKQIVVVGSATSNETTLQSGVPQGSVLRPMLFSLHVQRNGDIIYHHYADDL